MSSLIGWKVALVALVRFLPSVNEDVGLQMNSLVEWLLTLVTSVPLDSTVDLLVSPKAMSICKCFGTLVTLTSHIHYPHNFLGSSHFLLDFSFFWFGNTYFYWTRLSWVDVFQLIIINTFSTIGLFIFFQRINFFFHHFLNIFHSFFFLWCSCLFPRKKEH